MSRSTRRRNLGAGDLRLVAFGLVLTLAWTGLAARLFQVQVVRAGEFAAQSLEQRRAHKELASDRGTIYDRQGRELAVSVQGNTVYARPMHVADPEVAATLLSAVLRVDYAELLAKLASDAPFVYVARQVDFEKAAEVRDLGLSGISFLSEPKRVYPAGEMAAAVLGFVDIDNVGIEGLEYRYEDVLRGVPGEVIMERDPQGRVIPQGEYAVRPAEPGSDLVTTIDLDIQFAAERACAAVIESSGARRCMMVVLDPDTGAVLGMAVLPSFDPGDRNGADPETFQNYAVRGMYEPGSTQKLVTVAAALEEEAVRWNTLFPDVPYEYEAVPGACDRDDDELHGCFRDFSYHDPQTMTVKEIVTYSSNVGTILIQRRLGDEALRRYLADFGLGSRTGIDFSAEASGAVNVDPTCGSCTASAAIGYSVAVTPLQIAAAYAAVANDGVWVQPHLVQAVVDGEGVHHPIQPERRQVVSEQTARTMRLLLRSVVEDEGGTGRRAAIPGYTVGGKTGTADRFVAATQSYSDTETVASFVGMAPIADPRLVIAVVVDSPSHEYRTGGKIAAPAFADVMEKALHHLGVPPDAS